VFEFVDISILHGGDEDDVAGTELLLCECDDCVVLERELELGDRYGRYGSLNESPRVPRLDLDPLPDAEA
jgi:hypothetical protein